MRGEQGAHSVAGALDGDDRFDAQFRHALLLPHLADRRARAGTREERPDTGGVPRAPRVVADLPGAGVEHRRPRALELILRDEPDEFVKLGVGHGPEYGDDDSAAPADTGTGGTGRGRGFGGGITGTVSAIDGTSITVTAADGTPTQVAATILHEAMHARLDNAGVKYDPGSAAKHERFCRRAEVEFGMVAPDGAPVVDRALASLASADDEVAPAIDWELAGRRVNEADLAALSAPSWMKRAIARRAGLDDAGNGA